MSESQKAAICCCLFLFGCFAGRMGSTRDLLADRCGDAAHDCAVCLFTGNNRDDCRECRSYDDFCKDRKDRAEAQERDQAVQSLGLKTWPKTKDEETTPKTQTKTEPQTETKTEPQTETETENEETERE